MLQFIFVVFKNDTLKVNRKTDRYEGREKEYSSI